MGLKQGILWRGGATLLVCFLAGAASQRGLVESKAKNDSPAQTWVEWLTHLKKIEQTLQNEVARSIDQSKIVINTDPEAVYDHKAVMEGKGGEYEVEWDSGRTGTLPGPEKSLIRANLHSGNFLQHLLATFEANPFRDKMYYKISLKYALTDLEGKPLRRGTAEIFKDIGGRFTKISTSLIEGPSDKPPKEMTQVNLQAVWGDGGYLFLRHDEGVPTRVAEGQKHFCRNPRGQWLEETDPDWGQNCVPLFDGSPWHGFSFTMIPNSYKPF